MLLEGVNNFYLYGINGRMYLFNSANLPMVFIMRELSDGLYYGIFGMYALAIFFCLYICYELVLVFFFITYISII